MSSTVMNSTLSKTFTRAGLSILLAASVWHASAQAGVVREDILFLAEDGQHYTAYKTLRSDLPKREVMLEDAETAEDLIYFQPDDFQSQTRDGRTLLSFDGGSYALMRSGRFTPAERRETGPGVYRFESWDGKVLANKHYGKWNTPGPFARFAYVWVVPGNIDILKYNANRDGQWQKKGNTLAWSGSDVNDLTFQITYRVNPVGTPLALDLSGVKTPQDGDDLTRITLESGSLFPSGSHRFTAQGEQLLTELAGRLSKRDPAGIIVEGHTDNQALKPYLRETYPSNWELSAARATIVVRWLAEHGVRPEILEARAYGAQRPLADNSSASGRARNRRIEILVRDKPAGADNTQAPDAAADAQAAPDSGFVRKPKSSDGDS